MSSPAASLDLRIPMILKMDRENVYMQIRFLDLRAFIRNRVFKGRLFISMSAALQLQCEHKARFQVPV